MSSLNGQFRVLIFKYFKINQSFLTFFGKIPLEASQALNTCQKCGKMKNVKCPPFRLMCTVTTASNFSKKTLNKQPQKNVIFFVKLIKGNQNN